MPKDFKISHRHKWFIYSRNFDRAGVWYQSRSTVSVRSFDVEVAVTNRNLRSKCLCSAACLRTDDSNSILTQKQSAESLFKLLIDSTTETILNRSKQMNKLFEWNKCYVNRLQKVVTVCRSSHHRIFVRHFFKRSNFWKFDLQYSFCNVHPAVMFISMFDECLRKFYNLYFLTSFLISQ